MLGYQTPTIAEAVVDVALTLEHITGIRPPAGTVYMTTAAPIGLPLGITATFPATPTNKAIGWAAPA
jgi:hypothetical protein